MAQLVATIGADLCCLCIQHIGVYSDCSADQYITRFSYHRGTCRHVDFGVCVGGDAAVVAADDSGIENKPPETDVVGDVAICRLSSLLVALNRLLSVDGVSYWGGLFARHILVDSVATGGKYCAKSETTISAQYDRYGDFGCDDIRHADRASDWPVCRMENDLYEHRDCLFCGIAVPDFYSAASAFARGILGETTSGTAALSAARGHICADNAVRYGVLYRL